MQNTPLLWGVAAWLPAQNWLKNPPEAFSLLTTFEREEKCQK